MKKVTLTISLIIFATCLFAQELKQPAYFIDKLPVYPTTPKVYQQKLDSLAPVDLELKAAIDAYKNAQKTAQSKMDKAAIAKYYQSMTPAQIMAMTQAATALIDTTKEGVAKTMHKLNYEFITYQDQYEKEFETNIYPLDTVINSMIGSGTPAQIAKMHQLMTERKTEYQKIMEKYLLGDKALFPNILGIFRDYLTSTLIAKCDQIEKDQTQMFNLPYTPHTAALAEIQEYLGKFEQVIKNFKDYKDWGM